MRLTHHPRHDTGEGQRCLLSRSERDPTNQACRTAGQVHCRRQRLSPRGRPQIFVVLSPDDRSPALDICEVAEERLSFYSVGKQFGRIANGGFHVRFRVECRPLCEKRAASGLHRGKSSRRQRALDLCRSADAFLDRLVRCVEFGDSRSSVPRWIVFVCAIASSSTAVPGSPCSTS